MENTGSGADEESDDGVVKSSVLVEAGGGETGCGVGNDDGGDDSEELDKNVVGVPISLRKRKRGSGVDMLNWITRIARDPCDPGADSLPESSHWSSFKNKELWKQVLLVREELFLKRQFESGLKQHAWQKYQKMHPCLYDDHIGSSQTLTENRALDFAAEDYVRMGPSYQANVPRWKDEISESEPKWIGTQVWPQVNPKNHLIIEREPIGKGRDDSCGCQVPKSVECVRFHCTARKSRMKLELGLAFYQWGFDKMGEEVGLNWTKDEEKRFEDTMRSLSHDKSLWDELSRNFPTRRREDLVTYYYNVYVLRRRADQNRLTTYHTNTDDELEGGFVTNGNGHKSPSSLVSSAKKPRQS